MSEPVCLIDPPSDKKGDVIKIRDKETFDIRYATIDELADAIQLAPLDCIKRIE